MDKDVLRAVKEEVRKELEIATSGSSTANFSEIGSTGLNRLGGNIYEEFLPQLRWPRAAKIYQEMESNDPVVGAVLFVCEQLIRRVSWRVEGSTPEANEFIKSCLGDMSTTWEDTIGEIVSMLVYGFSWHEEVYKKREGFNRNPTKNSKYDDGRIGWRRLAGRAQNTIEQWKFDEDGGIMGAVQIAPPHYNAVVIPMEKSLLFRTRARYNNPEGRSLLRNAYRPWYFKKHIEEIEGIGIERDLAGLPTLIPPEGVDIWNPNDQMARQMKQQAEVLVRNIRRDQNEGVVLPHGWELTLMTTGGRRQFDTNAVINRYDQRIAATLLADIVMLGADKVGSFALATTKQGLLAASLEVVVHGISEIFNRHAIPRLFRLNAFPGLTEYPRLVPGQIITPSLTELARYLQVLAGSNMPLFPDTDLEQHLRALAGLPELTEKQIHERSEEGGSETDDVLVGTNGDTNIEGDTEGGDGRLLNDGATQVERR